MRLSHDGSVLSAALTFAYGGGGPTWRPELILGAPERGGEQFASDALGPAVARLLIERMGGTIRLDVAEGDRIAIVVRIPAVPVEGEEVRVRIETRSAAITMLCRAALKQDYLVFHADGDPGFVQTVLVEAGGPDEGSTVTALRTRFAGAQIVGIGRPENTAHFDGIASLPLDIDLLRAQVLRERRAS
jgi:hypothetical protein